MKKMLTSIVCLLLSVEAAFSIGFGFHAFEIRTNPEFSKGVFPTSLLYQFDFPIPNLLFDWATEVDFRIDNGLDFRTLRQHPDTGAPFAADPAAVDFPTEYITIYDEMNLVFGQGFFDSPLSEKDLFKLWFTFDIHLENSYERLAWLLNPTETEGLFYIQPKIGSSPAIERFPSSSWTGQPELRGNRSTIAPSFSFGFDIELMDERITRRNGLKYSFWTRLNPAWTAWFGDPAQDYLLLWNKLDLAFTLFSSKQDDERDLSTVSLVLDNETEYRYITGEKVPYYIQGGDIFGTKVLNTEHVITNRLSLTFYGPQVNSYDCYPLLKAFVDYGIGFGKLLNAATSTYYCDSAFSYGMRLEFVIFNIASIYLEIGHVENAVLNEQPKTLVDFGFSFGV